MPPPSPCAGRSPLLRCAGFLDKLVDKSAYGAVRHARGAVELDELEPTSGAKLVDLRAAATQNILNLFYFPQQHFAVMIARNVHRHASLESASPADDFGGTIRRFGPFVKGRKRSR